MNKIYLFLLTLFATLGVSQTAFADVWVNVPGVHNNWQDNGVQPESDNIAVHKGLALGNGEFKVRVWDGAEHWYGNGQALETNKWISISGDNGNMTIKNAAAGQKFDVYFNNASKQIKIVPQTNKVEIRGAFNGWAEGGPSATVASDGIARISGVAIGNGEFKVVINNYWFGGPATVAQETWVTYGAENNMKISGASAGQKFDVQVDINNDKIYLKPTVTITGPKDYIYRVYGSEGNLLGEATPNSGTDKYVDINGLSLLDVPFYVSVTTESGETFYSLGEDVNEDDNVEMLKNSKAAYKLADAVDGWKYIVRFDAYDPDDDELYVSVFGTDAPYWSYDFNGNVTTLTQDGGTFTIVAQAITDVLKLKMGDLQWGPEGTGSYWISSNLANERLVKGGQEFVFKKWDNEELFAPGTYIFTIAQQAGKWLLDVAYSEDTAILGWSYSINGGKPVEAVMEQGNNGVFYGFAGAVKQGDVIRFFYDGEPVSVKGENDYVITEPTDGIVANEYEQADGCFVVNKPGANEGQTVFFASMAFGRESYWDNSLGYVQHDVVKINVEDYVDNFDWKWTRLPAGKGAVDRAYAMLNNPRYALEKDGDDYVIRDIRCSTFQAENNGLQWMYSLMLDGKFYTTAAYGSSEWAYSFNPNAGLGGAVQSTPIIESRYQNPDATNANCTFTIGGSYIYDIKVSRSILGGWKVSAVYNDYPSQLNARFLNLPGENGSLYNDFYKTPFVVDDDNCVYYTATEDGPVYFQASTSLIEGFNIAATPDFSYAYQANQSYIDQLGYGDGFPVKVFTSQSAMDSAEGFEMQKVGNYYGNTAVPFVFEAEKGLTYKLQFYWAGPSQYPILYVKVFTDGSGGEYPAGWLDTTIDGTQASTYGVGFYLSGDINTWCSVYDRNWEFQNDKEATTSHKKGSDYKGYFCHEADGTYDYVQDDPEHPYLAWPTIREINRYWRFMPVSPRSDNPGFGNVTNVTTKSGKNLGSGEWYVLDLKARGSKDFHGHVGRLCGQFKITQGNLYWNDKSFGANNGGANDGYYNNVIKMGQTDYKAVKDGGANLATQATYIDNAVIYFNSQDGRVVIEGDPVEAYAYYALIEKDEDGNYVTDFSAPSISRLTTLDQFNYYAPKEAFENSRKLDNLDFTWEEVHNVPYTLNDGTVITLPKAYRKKLSSAFAHRNPAGYTVSVSRQNGTMFPDQRINCGDVWFIESVTHAYFRYADEILNTRPYFKPYFNAWIDQYDSNGIITGNKLYQTAQFQEMEWVPSVYDDDMPAKYDSYQGYGWFRTKQPIHQDFSNGGYAMFADTYGGFYPMGAPNVSSATKAAMQLQGIDFFYVVELDPRVRILYDKLNGTYAVHRDGLIDGTRQTSIDAIGDYLDGDQADNYSSHGTVFNTPYVLQINAEFLDEDLNIVTDYAHGIQYRFRVFDEKGKLVQNTLNGNAILGNDADILPDYYSDAAQVNMADTGWIDEPFFSWGLDQELKDFGTTYDPALDDTEGRFRVIMVQVRDAQGNVHTSQDLYEFYR